MLLLAFALPVLLAGAWIVEELDDDETHGETRNGSEGDDTLTGTTGNDLLRGNAGDDLMDGLDGNDTLFGHEGEDVLLGAGGADMLCSGDGDDIVTGNRGTDLIEGQGGNDWLSGDYSNDTVHGNEGEDTLIGGRGADVLNSSEDDDVVFGGIVTGLPLEAEGLEALRDGESLADVLAEDGHTINMRDDERGDILRGATGDDTLFVGGMDMAWGGAGADTYNIMADHTGENNIAQIMEWHTNQDSLGVVVNDGDEDMEITVSADGEDAIVRGDGAILARVVGAAGDFTASDIAIMAESTAATLLDLNAS